MPSLKRRDGEVEVTHNGPGAFGMPGGKTVRFATLACKHCSAHVVINPDRTRERAYCAICDAYICDICKAATFAPNYVHRPFSEIANLVMSGNWQLSGSLSNPILTPT